MSERYGAVQAEGEHGRAVQRLETARSQRSRLRDEHEAAKDTPAELAAGAALSVADDQVAARERWLESVDDSGY